MKLLTLFLGLVSLTSSYSHNFNDVMNLSTTEVSQNNEQGSIIVTPDGLRKSDDLNKKYIVIDIKDKTAEELYTNAIRYVNQNYLNPDEVLKGHIENEMITFTTHVPTIARIKKNCQPLINLDYTTQLYFKDGKVRLEIVNIELYYHVKNIRNVVNFCSGSNGMYYTTIYNKKRKLSMPNTKEDIDAYFADMIAKLEQALLQPKSNDDW